jgi:hypothetical protein
MASAAIDMPSIEWCPGACSLATWHDDGVFPGLGQHNCPYRYGVTHAAAVMDGKVMCKHFKPKR